jgi:ABC-type Na+ efflux pump permease subunit
MLGKDASIAHMSGPGFDPERYSAFTATVGVLALALAPIVSGWFILIAVPALLLACLSDTRQLYLFGPYLRTELRTHSRQTRVHIWRTLIAVIVGFPILSLYYVLNFFPLELQPRPNQVSGVASGIFVGVFWTLFLFVSTTAMQSLSFAIAEDRESKRHDFILASDLRGRELVIGKVFSRFLAILGYPLAALPLILMMPVLFRMDPAIILISIAYAVVSLFSLSGLAAFSSVVSTTRKQGSNWIAGLIFPYLILIFFLQMFTFYPAVWFFPGTNVQPPWLSFGDVVGWISVGNPLALLINWLQAGAAGGDLRILVADLPGYSSFHILVGGFSFLLAVRWIRSTEANSGEVVSPNLGDPNSSNPEPVHDECVFWKDVFCHKITVGARQHPLANRIAAIVLIVLPALVCLASIVSDLNGYRKFVVDLARYYPMIVTWFAMVISSQLGVQSVVVEREKDTLLMLLQTALSPVEILRQKYWALIRLGRGAFVWNLAVGIPAVLCGSLPWWAYLGMVVLHIVSQFEMAAVGLLFSADSPNIRVVNRRFGVMVGLVVFCATVFAGLLLYVLGADSPVRYLLVGVFPPVMLVALDFAKYAPGEQLPFWIAGFLAGQLLNVALTLWFWRIAKRRFVAACDPGSEAGPMLDGRTTR